MGLYVAYFGFHLGATSDIRLGALGMKTLYQQMVSPFFSIFMQLYLPRYYRLEFTII